jgi:hypothetical protein
MTGYIGLYGDNNELLGVLREDVAKGIIDELNHNASENEIFQDMINGTVAHTYSLENLTLEQLKGIKNPERPSNESAGLFLRSQNNPEKFK